MSPAAAPSAPATPDVEAIWRGLSKPRRGLLALLFDDRWRAFDAKYPPVVGLTALGLIEGKPQRFGGWCIRVTDLGRAVRAHGAGLAAARNEGGAGL